MAKARSKVTVTIGWADALEAVCDIVDDTPHFGEEFSLENAERLEKAAGAIRKALGSKNAVTEALEGFVECINSTGGVTLKHDPLCGRCYVPVADKEWPDLGDAYDKACSALGCAMIVDLWG